MTLPYLGSGSLGPVQGLEDLMFLCGEIREQTSNIAERIEQRRATADDLLLLQGAVDPDSGTWTQRLKRIAPFALTESNKELAQRFLLAPGSDLAADISRLTDGLSRVHAWLTTHIPRDADGYELLFHQVAGKRTPRIFNRGECEALGQLLNNILSLFR